MSLVDPLMRGLYLEHPLVRLDGEGAHVIDDIGGIAAVIGVEGDLRALLNPDGDDHGRARQQRANRQSCPG